MKSWNRFLLRNRNKGIKNLMLYICIGQAAAFILTSTSTGFQIWFDYLLFVPSKILHGEVWRLVTFLLIPSAGDVFSVVLSFMFYYFIGRMLEEAWGTFMLNLYYLTGVVAYIIFGFVLSYFHGDLVQLVLIGQKLNMSLFLAYAALNPDGYVRVYLLIPIKVKWLALINLAVMLWGMTETFPMNLAPLVALVNFLFYFTGPMINYAKRSTKTRKARVRHAQYVRGTREPDVKRHRHRCIVCGKTDVSHPGTEFRYCGQCKGYVCYCEEHIYNHTHIS